MIDLKEGLPFFIQDGYLSQIRSIRSIRLDDYGNVFLVFMLVSSEIIYIAFVGVLSFEYWSEVLHSACTASDYSLTAQLS